MFTKIYVAPNGANTQFHSVKRIEAANPTDFITAHVQSFLTQDDALSGTAVPSWNQPVQVPKSALAGSFDADIEQWLVSAEGSPFLGAAIVAVTNTDLVAAKIKQWARVKGARDAAIAAGFEWDGSRFDSDLQSRIFVEGAALLATLAMMNSQPFGLDFTLQDNSVRSMTGADVIAAGTAMGVHIMSVHAIGRTLRAAIEAAATVAEVDAVTWPA